MCRRCKHNYTEIYCRFMRHSHPDTRSNICYCHNGLHRPGLMALGTRSWATAQHGFIQYKAASKESRFSLVSPLLSSVFMNWLALLAERAISRIKNMVRDVNFGKKTYTSQEKPKSFNVVLYTEHNGTAFAAISEILMK